MVKMKGIKNRGAIPPRPPSGLFKLDPQNEVSRTLHSFLSPKPSLSGRHFIKNLTGERVHLLEESFEKGGRITKIEGQPWLIELPTGSMTHWSTFKISREDIVFYWLWKNHFGFPEAIEKQAAKFWRKNKDAAEHWGRFQDALETWGKIQKRAQALGIKISHELQKEGEILKFDGQLRLIHQILELLPNSLLKTPKLQGIKLCTERKWSPEPSVFQNDELFLYHGTFQGSRRNLAGIFLQGLGYATAGRYLLGDQGDPHISKLIRKKMHRAYRVIAHHRAMIGLDHAGGSESRKHHQGKDLGNFISELHLIYVAAGPLLRQHIASFPENSPVSRAWKFVYRELRDRIFAGREYDYSPLIETSSKTTDPPLRYSSHPPNLLNPKTVRPVYPIIYQWGRYYLEVPEAGSELILGRKNFQMSKKYKDISSYHLRLFGFENFYFVQDLGSKNGTIIIPQAEKKIVLQDSQRNPTMPYPILSGDRIALPGIELGLIFPGSG
jgi:hypothetical protein